MKRTLLELTQAVLSSMDSDEVSTISETTEALQVVEVIKTCYYDIVEKLELTKDKVPVQLEPSIDIDLPIAMYLPEGVEEVTSLYYDEQTIDSPIVNYVQLKAMPFEDFLAMTNTFDTTKSYTSEYTFTIGTDTWTFKYYNDRGPTYYTTPDDKTFLFDAYDSAVDSTLQKSKTLAKGRKDVAWSLSDTFTPDLDDSQSQLLLHEAKALAFAELKQSQHAKAEKTARDYRIDQQRRKTKVPLQSALDRAPNFGRK
jgi:hypothetical protein